MSKNETNVILKISHLDSFYGRGKSRRQVLYDVSLSLHAGEVLGIVGESGSGKTTLARAILGFAPEIRGEISLNARRPQLVFQDPYGSLNPAKTVGWILQEPLRAAKIRDKKLRLSSVYKMLNLVGLKPEYFYRRPHELSGGERQRVAIAAALIEGSKLIILDEPVSALDVTLQAQILELLVDLKEELDLSYIFISHDLSVIYEICDRVCVMYHGRIVEEGDVDTVYDHPQNEYTKALLKASLY